MCNTHTWACSPPVPLWGLPNCLQRVCCQTEAVFKACEPICETVLLMLLLLVSQPAAKESEAITYKELKWDRVLNIVKCVHYGNCAFHAVFFNFWSFFPPSSSVPSELDYRYCFLLYSRLLVNQSTFSSHICMGGLHGSVSWVGENPSSPLCQTEKCMRMKTFAGLQIPLVKLKEERKQEFESQTTLYQEKPTSCIASII